MIYYICEVCGEEWETTIDEDAIADGIDDVEPPTICPLCEMPVTQMMRDCYEVAGVGEVFRMLKLRYLSNIWKK